MKAEHPSSSIAEASTNEFNIGDKVSYVVMTGIANGYQLSARMGEIIVINGDVATVKSRNGRSSMQPLSKLTPEGQHNALTRMLAGGQ
ncbi:hypothetical protein [Pseudomonas lundensis]|uniref:Uncharacterized protein n=1 Tax=Pseudomonas lundensis TaxID=86185 RepID=A0AAX2H9Y0_9PSED|nr:hypothetical protein [Pseudomonas lundensis]SOB53791.1 conserved hypothetical protein [Pseudomonas lundensis]